MKRKLISVLLCGVAMLLLMGASAQTGLDVPEDEDIVWEYRDPEGLEGRYYDPSQMQPEVPPEEDDTQPAPEQDPVPEQKPEEEPEQDPAPELEPAPDPGPEEEPGTQPEENPAAPQVTGDAGFLIDGTPAPLSTGRTLQNGVTYVVLADTAGALSASARTAWDQGSRTATVTAPGLTIKAQADAFYIQANDRYLYVQDGVQMSDGRLTVPLKVLTEASRGDGVLASAWEVYDPESLFWLSRIIYAESGNQPLKGQVAVGNVILNRVANPLFPNTIEEVLAAPNQFTTYANGALADRVPNESSVLAAKLVLDGAVVEEVRGALYFDSMPNSWAIGVRPALGRIGGHNFYG